MSEEYTIVVHTIAEDGLPPNDLEEAGLIGRVAFIFDGALYSGWPEKDNDDPDEDDPSEITWRDGVTSHAFTGIEKWVELPVPAWDL